MKTFILVALLLICTACSAVPKLDKVDDFSVAADNSTELLKTAAAANRNIAIRRGEESEAVNYITKAPFTLLVQPEAALDERVFTARLETLNALQAYAKALKLAVDEGVTTKLEEASARLGTTGGSIAASSPLAAPAFKIAASGLGYALTGAHARRVQAIVKATDPDVQKVTKLLQKDFKDVAKDLKQQLSIFNANRHAALAVIRGNSSLDRLALRDRLELYREFKMARQDVSAQQALIAAVENYDQILEGLGKAHAALASGEPDNDVALKRFVALTNDLVDLFTAATKEKAT